MRPVQFSEQSGMEERPKAQVLAEVVTDLKMHYDTVWIAASRDSSYPLIIVGVEKGNIPHGDPPIENFSSEWLSLWRQMYAQDMDIWVVNASDMEFQMEWELLVDKRIDFDRTLEWMESRFFQPDPFEDSGPEVPKAGLEELSGVLFTNRAA